MTWPTKKLNDVCNLERGTEPGSAFYVKASDKATPFLRVGDLTGKVDAPRFVKNDNGNLQIINENETLITFDGTPGIVVRGFKGAIASGIRVVRNIKPEIDRNFLFYYLQTPGVKKTIKAYSKGATIIHASSAIQHIKISLPSLATQKQIVGRLDKITEAQKLNSGLIQKTEELFQSLLHKELDPTGKDWGIKRVKDILSREKYSVGKLKRQEYQKFGTYPIIDQSVNGIAGYSENGKAVYSGKLPLVIYGDHTRIIKFVDKPFILGADGTKILIPRDEILANYLYFVLHLYNVAGQGYKRHFSLLKEIKIPVPPLKIQKQIVVKLSAVWDYKKQLLEQRAKLKELFDSVLSKSFSG